MNRNILKDGTLLYNKNENCCGCGICSLSCSKKAISMKEDVYGYVYPVIDANICVNCKKCVEVCAFLNTEGEIPQNTYAAVNSDRDQLQASTSGGVFSAIAASFIKEGHAVVGCTMDIKDGTAHVYHKMISVVKDLPRLQGSKYVQSDLTKAYDDILYELKAGSKVLISGTPCQIAAIKKLLAKYIDQIYTIDLICHGVPNQRFFDDYLRNLQVRSGKQLADFCFRDKSHKWGLCGSYVLTDEQKYKMERKTQSYYDLFLDCETFRDSCYSCPYACGKRVGDLTIGDYWGVKKQSPEILTENGGRFDTKDGISCIMQNSDKGKQLLETYGENLILQEVPFENIAKHNPQLREPSKHTQVREKIISKYCDEGYDGVEKYWKYLRIKKELIRFPRRCIGAMWRKIKRMSSR